MSITRDAARLNRKLARIPKFAEAAVRPAMEKQAERIAGVMRRLAPPFIEIAWKWGGAPRGAVRLAAIGGSGPLRITIYATGKTSEYAGGFPAVAAWFEFGTAERRHKSGKSTGRITAQPYFYPGFRLYRKPAGAAIRRAMRKAIREAFK